MSAGKAMAMNYLLALADQSALARSDPSISLESKRACALESGATFSPCRRYRYKLWRRWQGGRPLCCCLLNPSTADEARNGPTVERCQRRAVAMGFPGLIVVNLFAFRATDPKAMMLVDDPIGPDNDAAILEAARESSVTLCGWGGLGAFRGRGRAVLERLWEARVNTMILGLTKGGEPRHLASGLLADLTSCTAPVCAQRAPAWRR